MDIMKLDVAEFEAIDLLTQQTDYRGLCDCLLSALATIAPRSTTKLLEVYDDRGYSSWRKSDRSHFVVREYPTLSKCEQPSWLVDAVSRSATSGEVTIIHQPHSLVIGFGALSGLCRFVEIRDPQNANVSQTITRIARIFSNLLQLIDKFERDPLTGLLNRQSFDYRFDDLIEYHRKNPNRETTDNTPWIAIVDIDHFKLVNDTFGHLFGDEILLLVSQIMRQSFRFDDLFFRYGGEEFIVILNNTNAIGAELALERFRAAVENYAFPRLKGLSVSIGWTGIDTKGYSTDVIDEADKALYWAKDHGRNKVVGYAATFDP